MTKRKVAKPATNNIIDNKPEFFSEMPATAFPVREGAKSAKEAINNKNATKYPQINLLAIIKLTFLNL